MSNTNARSPNRSHRPVVALALDDRHLRHLRRIAARDGVSVATALRVLLDREIASGDGVGAFAKDVVSAGIEWEGERGWRKGERKVWRADLDASVAILRLGGDS